MERMKRAIKNYRGTGITEIKNIVLETGNRDHRSVSGSTRLEHSELNRQEKAVTLIGKVRDIKIGQSRGLPCQR